MSQAILDFKKITDQALLTWALQYKDFYEQARNELLKRGLDAPPPISPAQEAPAPYQGQPQFPDTTTYG